MTVIPMHLCVLLYTFNVIQRVINIVFSVTLVLKSHFMWMGIRINELQVSYMDCLSSISPMFPFVPSFEPVVQQPTHSLSFWFPFSLPLLRMNLPLKTAMILQRMCEIFDFPKIW